MMHVPVMWAVLVRRMAIRAVVKPRGRIVRRAGRGIDGNMRPRVLGLRARHEKRASECDDDRDHIPSPFIEHNEFLQNFIVTRFQG